MKIFRTIQLGLLQRRLLRTLGAIEEQLTLQNKLLTRLADHFVPVAPPVAEDLLKQNSVTFLDHTEAGRVLDYIEKTLNDTGRSPTEDEIIQYLADEATEALINDQKGPTLEANPRTADH